MRHPTPPFHSCAAASNAALRRRLHETLRDVFGLDSLRDGQHETITSVLAGKPTLAIMPTGAGKSLCYQLPALLLPGATLVVSPLISLMKDQCDKLRALGIAAVQLNSSLNAEDAQAAECAIADGRAKIVFTTPERLGSDEFLRLFASRPPSLLVIDEAHCISQWGHDFRPAFLDIGNALPRLGRPALLALTATATREVVDDIAHQLRVKQLEVIDTGVYRPNLRLRVEPLERVEDKLRRLVERVNAIEGAGIVYCATVRAAVEAHDALRAAGVETGLYHGRLGARQRREQQEAFMRGDLRVVVATNAFGLGIDKRDTRFVIHYQLPGGLDAYYQEAGRAGRDGADALCELLYLPQDRAVQKFFLAGKYPTTDELARVYRTLLAPPADGGVWSVESLQHALEQPASTIRAVLSLLRQHRIVHRDAAARGGGYALRDTSLDAAALDRLFEAERKRREHDRELLEEMIAYAQSGQCRWKQILDHFGEAQDFSACHTCDNCERIAAAEAEAAAEAAADAAATMVTSEPITVEAGATSPPSERPTFEPGNAVVVPHFGSGIVVSADATGVSVRFGDEDEPRTFIESVVTSRSDDTAAPLSGESNAER